MIEGQLYAGELVAWWCDGFEDHKYLTVGVVNLHTQPEESRVYVRTMFGSVVVVKRADLIRAPFVLSSDVVQVQPETPRDPLADFPVGSFVVWTECGDDGQCWGIVCQDHMDAPKYIRHGESQKSFLPDWTPSVKHMDTYRVRLCDPVKENRVRCYKIDADSWMRLVEGSLTGHPTTVAVAGGEIPPDARFVSVDYDMDNHKIYMAHPMFSPVYSDCVYYPLGGKITVTISKGDTEDA
jgi:hypothetical protein